MKTIRPRLISGCLSLMLILVIVVAGCGGGDGNGGGATQVKDGASVVKIDSGGFIEIPEGALPEGAEVSVETTRTPVLPDGVEAVGEALAISATADLTEPATLHLPVPAGVGNASNLVIIRVESDGATTFLMTSVEGDELVAATPGFSTFSIGELLDGRKIFILGVSNLIPGERAVYELLGMRRISEGVWTVTGAASSTASNAHAVVVQASDRRGRALVEYAAVDLARGWRWYGSVRIFVMASGSSENEFKVHLYASRSLVYAGTEFARFTAIVTGTAVKLPITWTWDYGDGEKGGPATNDRTTYTLPPKDYAGPEGGRHEVVYHAKITAQDSAGHSQSETYLIHVQREPLAVAIDGPQRLTWNDPGVSADYAASTTGGQPVYRYSWSLSPGGVERTVEAFDTLEASFTSVESFTFDQPGGHRLEVIVSDDSKETARATLPIIVEGGEPLSTHMLDLPATAEAGDLVTVSIQVRGGVLAVSGKKAGYELHFDWGDRSGTVVEKDVGLRRTPYQGTVFTLSHPYAKADTFPVSVEVWDATGNSAKDSREITIEEGGGDTDGGDTGTSTGPFFTGEWHFIYDWPGHHRTEGTLEFLPPRTTFGVASAGRFSYSGTRTYPSGNQVPRDGSGPWEFNGPILSVTDTIEGVPWEVSSGHYATPLQPASTLVLTSPFGTLTLTR